MLKGQENGKEKENLLTTQKFPIHTHPKEASGITVAELAKARSIPFTPDPSGQTEIVPFEELQFGAVDGAAGKIDRILKSENEQFSLQQLISRQTEKFSVEKFCIETKRIVNEWVAAT